MNYKFIHPLLFLLLVALLPPAVYAQDDKEAITFFGQLKDKNDQPLAGVTVKVQERDIATTTDSSGKFSIKTVPNDVLIFRKRGYLTVQKVLDATVDAKASLDIALDRALTDAGDDDNVEIPFGTRKKRQITTAVSTVKPEQIPLVPVSDLKNVFVGRLPGLYLNQSNTQPGSTTDAVGILIRGRSSYNIFNNNTNARVLVDGVQREFGDMDQNEIESITVLKDAAALAWYGLRGGNGVVLVTTKKGSPVRNSIRFDVQGGLQTPHHLIRPLNSYDFATLYNEALRNDGAAPIYDQADLDAYRDGSDPYRYPNNNYISEFLKKSAPVQRYVLSADGGNNNIRYFALLSYFDQDGLFKGTKSADFDSNIGFKRFNFRGNIDFTVNKDLTITLNAGGRAENRLFPGSNGVETNGASTLLSLLYNTPPNAYPILNEDGSYGGSAAQDPTNPATTGFSTNPPNPLGQIRDRGYVSAIDRVLLATLDVRHKLDFVTKGLSANILFSYDANGTYSSGLNKDYEVYDFARATPAVFRNKTPLGYRTAQFSNNNRRNEFWAGLDYDRSFGEHTVNASVRGQRFLSVQPERLDFRNQGLAARVDYGFKQRYFLGVVAGYSGSENYPAGKRYGLFPAVSAGWVISEEYFLRFNPVLSYLKLRASHGSSGNDQIGGNRFPFESFYSRNPNGGGYVFGTGFSASNTASETNLGNPNITWETITTSNVGADFKFLNNALSLSADLFKTRRSDILTFPRIPGIPRSEPGLGERRDYGQPGRGGRAELRQANRPVGVVLQRQYSLRQGRVLAQNGQDGLPSTPTVDR